MIKKHDEKLTAYVRMRLQQLVDDRWSLAELARKIEASAAYPGEILRGECGVSLQAAENFCVLLGFSTDLELIIASREWCASRGEKREKTAGKTRRKG